MSQEVMVRGAVIFLVLFVALLYYFSLRARSGKVPTLRRIRAFETLKGLPGRAIENGGSLHLALGSGSVVNETTADSLAGLNVLNYLGEQAAATGESPTVTMADPMLMVLAQNTLRAAHNQDTERAEEAYRRVQWVAPQPAAYAAGVMGQLTLDKVEANVMVGSFGDEYLLIGEQAVQQGIPQVGGASQPTTLPFVYVTTPDGLMGEEIYAAGAYLQNHPTHLASLVTQDAMRWLIGLTILGGIIWATVVN
jgi:hypothetical protein